MTLKVEAANPDAKLREAGTASLRSVSNLMGTVAWVAASVFTE